MISRSFFETLKSISLVLVVVVSTIGGAGVRASDWPQLLGPDRNGVYQGEPVWTHWGSESPKTLWSVALGEGFAGPVAVEGTVFVVHREGDEMVLDALRVADGSRVWRATHSTRYRDDFGFSNGPRATPVVDGGRVFTFSPDGALQAVDRVTGERRWIVETSQIFDVERSFFGAASSPLVVGDRVLVNIGGRQGAGVVAFDVATGATVWQAANDGASYSSPILASIDGTQQAIFFTREGLLVLDPGSGEISRQLRWRSRLNASVNAATPVVVGDRVFLSSSYGTGAVLVALASGKQQEIWRSDQSLTNHYATSLHHDGFLFGFHGRQESGPSLRCIRLDTGEVVWSEERFGAGSVILANDRLLILRESGELITAPASPAGFSPTVSTPILGRGTRAYPALADGIFFARDDEKLVAVDLRQSMDETQSPD